MSKKRLYQAFLAGLRNSKIIYMAFICMLFTIKASAQENQQLQISGTVKDEFNLIIPGVTIKNLHTKKVSITDEKGKFSIQATRGDSIAASFVGYRTFTIAVKDVINLTITLQAAANSLNEVAIVGYGQQKKISVVGAQSTVNLEDIKQPVANISAALAGRISGLVGVQRSGLPGQNGADLWIRGIATFNGQNNASPLVVIDGVQGRDLDNLDAEDISSFTILKDASATAIYGVAGANGVILINTKKGVSGKTTLMFNYNQGITSFTKRPELTDGVTYMMLRNEARVNTGLGKDYSNNYINSTILKEDPNLYPDVDWMKELFNNTAQNRRVNFSARGGSETSTYYISGAYYDEQSLLKTDALQKYDASTNFKRYNFTSNVSTNWTSTTKFDLGIQGNIASTNYPAVDLGNPNSSVGEIFGAVMQTNPVLYPKIYPGNIVPGVSDQGAQPNPWDLATQRGVTNLFSNQIYSNARLTQDLKFWVPGLSVSALFSFDVNNAHGISRYRTRNLYMIDRSNPYNDDGSANFNAIKSDGYDNLKYQRYNDGNRQFYTEASVNYDHSFGKKSHITGLLLFNQSEKIYQFATDVTSSLSFRRQGLAGRTTYSYDEKYFGEVNFGYNGSENFAPDKKFGFFPSFGVGWIVSKENFYEPLKGAIDYFKLRYSDGIVGDGGSTSNIDGSRRFGYLTLVTAGDPNSGYTYGTPSSGQGVAGTYINSYGTNVQWARSHKRDLGIELYALKSQFSLTVDLFTERRTGVFLNRQLPGIVGVANAPSGNLGIITNKGIDATLLLNPVKIGAFTLDMRGTFTYNRDKVIEDDSPVQPFPYMNTRGTNYLARFGYVATGLFKDQQDISGSADQTKTFGQIHPGDIKYKDLNGDGVIDANDRTRIGNGDVPTTTYGIGFNLQYKHFYFGLFFQGVGGADRLLTGDGILPFNNSTGPERSNLFAIAEDRWTPENPNPNAFYPRLAYGNSANKNNSEASSWWVKSISFVRLKTADFGYNLPSGTLKSLGVKNSRIYLQGLNLLYWSPFKLWDPELNTSNGTAYPNIRTITAGVQANF